MFCDDVTENAHIYIFNQDSYLLVMCVYRYYGWLYVSGFVPCTCHSGRVICFF